MAALLPVIILKSYADQEKTLAGSGGGSSQMFVYMGDNGEVLIAADPSGPSGEPGPTGATVFALSGYPQPCPVCHAVGCDCSLNAEVLGHRTDSFGRCLWPEKCPTCKTVLAVEPPAEPTPGSIDFDIGYAAAIKDVLAQIIVAGKQNLVQWLEKKLEQL
jgi:hypothetical protein